MRFSAAALALALVAACGSASSTMSPRIADAIRAEANRFAAEMPANTVCPWGALALNKCLLESLSARRSFQSATAAPDRLSEILTSWRLSESELAQAQSLAADAISRRDVAAASSLVVDDSRTSRRVATLRTLVVDASGPSIQVASLQVTVDGWVHLQSEERTVKNCFACRMGSRELCCTWNTEVRPRAFTPEELERIAQGMVAAVYTEVTTRLQGSTSTLRGATW